MAELFTFIIVVIWCLIGMGIMFHIGEKKIKDYTMKDWFNIMALSCVGPVILIAMIDGNEVH